MPVQLKGYSAGARPSSTSYGGPSEASVNNQIALANAQLDAWEEKNA